MAGKRFRMLLATLALLVMVTGCSSMGHKEAMPQLESPDISQQLDSLYATDKLQWKEEMRSLIGGGGEDIPVKHLAYALKYFNQKSDSAVMLKATWLYLKKKAGNAPTLSSKTDRKLLESYAEVVLGSGNQAQVERFNELCTILESEEVCKSNFR